MALVQRSVRRKRSEEVQPELLGPHPELLVDVFATLIANANLLAVLTTVIDAWASAIRANDRDWKRGSVLPSQKCHLKD